MDTTAFPTFTETPVCTRPIDAINGRVIECGAPLVDRWMETVRCEHGHWERFNTARWIDDLEGDNR